MLKNNNIICISSIDWDFIWQGHQEIMSALAKNGNRVIFIENTGVRAPGIKDIPRIKSRIKNYFKGVKGIRQEQNNLYIFSPIVLPFPYSRIARWVNKILLLSVLKKWMAAIDFTDPVIWTFLPTSLAADIIDGINKKLVIYHCVDDFSASSGSVKKIRATEKKVLEKADLVFVTAKALYDYCIKYNGNVHIFPSGVNIGDFEDAKKGNSPIPEKLKGIKQPIIGYVGGIHKWVDLHLVKYIAGVFPDYSFVFIGPLQTDVSLLSGFKNIHFLGNIDHKELPYFIKYFTVATVPYVISEYTKNVYPAKLNEYLAMGKPVVSAKLQEIEGINEKYGKIIYIGKNAEDFAGCIGEAIKEDNEALRLRRIEIAKGNSWQGRIEKMGGLIEGAIDKKALNSGIKWREDLLSFYRAARKKFLRAVFSLSFIYILFFYTPFVWLIAEPLRIIQAPVHADCIVVFAGGVGESGKAGQGYEERVKRAVELFKDGYAKHMIFSSGYKYVFNEAMVMKALAVSLGAPADAIIVEDKARNTYENVVFTKQIIGDKAWKAILLISSPYNMRRASLVFNKVDKDIAVTYAMPDSLFYSHFERDSFGRRIWKRINIEQINGIFHEYLGIVYYWLRGRI